MTDKTKLKEMLIKRNPLLDTKREAVTPVNLYTKPQVDSEGIQVDKNTSTQVDKQTNTQEVKPTTPRIVKYTTHLKPETIKALRRYAFDHEIKDYQLVQEAIDAYLKGKK